jgi:hypothetical protein
LENDLQLPSTDGGPNQLEPIRIRFVPSHFKIGKETLNSLLKRNPVRSKLVRIEIILEIRRPEPAPIHHGQIVACPFQLSKKRSGSSGQVHSPCAKRDNDSGVQAEVDFYDLGFKQK